MTVIGGRSLVNRRQVENDGPVGFFAVLTDHVEHAGELQSIAFDTAVTNEGSAYTPHTGIFVAPVGGLYVFSSTLTSYPHNNAIFSFLKNGNPVSHLHPHSDSDSPAYDTSAMTIVLELGKGDDVSVANRHADESLNGHRLSTFSGFLLYQYYSEATTVVGK